MRKAHFAFLVLTLLMFSAMLAPVLAKNFNIPEDEDRVYFNNGSGFVTAPNNWVPGFSSVTLRIKGLNVEAGTYGSADNLQIDMSFMSDWIPLAYFTTSNNPELVAWEKTLLSGFPVAVLPLNIKSVSASVLQVERHGNSIAVELTAPQTILYPTSMTTAVPVVIPAFSMHLTKVGGSVHTDSVLPLTGYTGASGWTGYIDLMGFNANGVFTSPGWNSQMTDCSITMHGIATWVPP